MTTVNSGWSQKVNTPKCFVLFFNAFINLEPWKYNCNYWARDKRGNESSSKSLLHQSSPYHVQGKTQKKKKNSAFLKHNELDLHIAPTFLHLSKITHYPLKSSSNEPFLIPLFLTHHLSISNPPACPLTVLKYGLIHQFLVITEAVQATPSLA